MGHHRFKGEHLEGGAMGGGGRGRREAVEEAVALCTGDKKTLQYLQHCVF